MTTVAELLRMLGHASLGAFWLPLALWTLAALLFLAVGRRGRRGLPPLVHYGTHLALLLALPAGLLLTAAVDVTGVAGRLLASGALPGGASAEGFAVTLPALTVTASGAAWDAYTLLGGLTLLAGLLAGWHTGRLALQAVALYRFRRRLPGMPDARVQQLADRLAARLGIRRRVRVAVSAVEVVPVTFGWRRPLILIPASLADEAQPLAMVLTHELVHIRRGDYLAQWTEQVIAALFPYHPLVARLRDGIHRYREMACDAEVLGHAAFDRRHYAELLFRFVLPSTQIQPLALGMAVRQPQLKERLVAMKSYDPTTTNLRHSKRLALTLSGLLMGLCVLFVACSDVVQVDDPKQQTASEAAATNALTTADEMPEIVGGLAAIAGEIRYPEIARRAGIEGRVVLRFVVDEEGKVVNPEVVKGLGGGCDAEALRALQQATFRPGRVDGKPVRVQMTLPFTFKLPQEEAQG